jgi:hypothetical protein
MTGMRMSRLACECNLLGASSAQPDCCDRTSVFPWPIFVALGGAGRCLELEWTWAKINLIYSAVICSHFFQMEGGRGRRLRGDEGSDACRKFGCKFQESRG